MEPGEGTQQSTLRIPQTPTMTPEDAAKGYNISAPEEGESKLPPIGMADGGDVPQPSPSPSPQPVNLPGANSAQDSMRNAFHFDVGGSVPPPSTSELQAQDQAIMNQPSQQEIQSKTADVLPNSNGMVDTSQAYQQGQQAITQQGETAGQSAEMNQPAMQKDLAARQELDSNLKNNMAKT